MKRLLAALLLFASPALATEVASPYTDVEMQAAVNTACASDHFVHLGAQTYALGAAVNITCGLAIYGNENQSAIVTLGSTTQNGFYVNTVYSDTFRDFTIQPASGHTQTAGAAIYVTAPGNNNYRSSFLHMRCVSLYDCIKMDAAAYWIVDDLWAQSVTHEGIHIANHYNYDAGDNRIIDSLFCCSGNYTAIYQESGDGLRVTNNKILGAAYGYRGVFAAVPGGSDIVIDGNSIEGTVAAAVALTPPATNPWNFFNFQVIGNQIGIAAGYGISVTQHPANITWLQQANFNDNVFTIIGSPGYGISIYGVADFTISGNSFKSNMPSPYTNTGGIAMQSGNYNGMVCGNTVRFLASPYYLSPGSTGIDINAC